MSKYIEKSEHGCSIMCGSCTCNHNALLSGLEPAKRSKLDENRTQFSYKKGQYIFKEGIMPSGIFCLQQGKVMIVKEDENGNSIITNLHKEVCFIGIADFIINRPYDSKCIALSDVKVCKIPSKNMLDFMSEDKVFSRRIMTTLSEQLNESNERMLASTKKHMDARLAKALIELENVFGKSGDGFIDVYLKRSELAILSNMSEANLIRQLSSFQSLGILLIDHKKLQVTDIERMKKLSKM